MKRILAMIISLCMITTLVACGPTITEEDIQEELKQGVADLQDSLRSQYLVAVNASVFTDENNSKWLMADIENNMVDEIDISQLVIAFLAWDENGVPVQIKTEKNPDNTYYLFEMTVGNDVVIPKDGTWAADKGLHLSEGCSEIAYVEAIAVSGVICAKAWENPCYDTWYEMYHKQLLTDWQKESMTNYGSEWEADFSDTTESTAEEDTDQPDAMPFSDFYDYLLAQEVVALHASLNSPEQEKTGLMADIKNNMVADATEISLAFAMWDENGDPLMITSASGQTADSYVKEVGYGDVMVEGKETWTADRGLIIANERGTIAHVEAIVVSCKLNGSDWTNPMYAMWKDYFGGQRLESEMLDVINSFSEA